MSECGLHKSGFGEQVGLWCHDAPCQYVTHDGQLDKRGLVLLEYPGWQCVRKVHCPLQLLEEPMAWLPPDDIDSSLDALATVVLSIFRGFQKAGPHLLHFKFLSWTPLCETFEFSTPAVCPRPPRTQGKSETPGNSNKSLFSPKRECLGLIKYPSPLKALIKFRGLSAQKTQKIKVIIEKVRNPGGRGFPVHCGN